MWLPRKSAAGVVFMGCHSGVNIGMMDTCTVLYCTIL